MPFKERFEVSGTLTTEGPLHIGCGQTVTHPNLRFEQGEGPEQQVEIGAVARDYAGRPYIPGSTLKGRLREDLTATRNQRNAGLALWLERAERRQCQSRVCRVLGFHV